MEKLDDTRRTRLGAEGETHRAVDGAGHIRGRHHRLGVGFNWTLELTNTEEFCISCHEMRENVFKKYRHTIHYANRTGVRATCPDCHVPRPWVYKIVRKIRASNEVWH